METFGVLIKFATKKKQKDKMLVGSMCDIHDNVCVCVCLGNVVINSNLLTTTVTEIGLFRYLFEKTSYY